MNQTHRFMVLIGEQLGSDKTIVTDEPGVGVVDAYGPLKVNGKRFRSEN